ncbi:MAG TPA: Xaa-Pro aminopeptidase, partial [Flavobacteriaceae bacterium]|nr:Xaa-Pro aminopeptidase [Flavobacteriaceae bacterium]
AWDKEKQPDQWARLIELIQERNPNKIGVNISEHYGIADGLVQTDYSEFMEHLPESFKSRVVSAEPLAVSWVETRTQSEMKEFEALVQVTHDIIAEAFSTRVITPGKTTSEEVVWWLRQKVSDLGLDTWFHPTVDIQRNNEALKSHIEAFSNGYQETIIMPGDLLHCDFGVSYMGLNTDCQQHAYVPLQGESEVPEFLNKAFASGNRVQDIFTGFFALGITGNEILRSSLEKGRAEGLRPSIYTHPLGSFGHSAGTTLGMWDAQQGVPGSGDYPMAYKTAYAIELNNTIFIPEWDKDVRIMLEEAGYFDQEGFRYVNGRQETIRLVR